MYQKAFKQSGAASRDTSKSRNMYYPVTQVRLSLLTRFPQINFLLKCSGGVINHRVYETSHCKDIKRKVHLTLITRKVTKNESPGQTESQIVASSGKLNLRGDLRWVAKRTQKFPRKYTQVAKKIFKADYSLFHWLIIG